MRLGWGENQETNTSRRHLSRGRARKGGRQEVKVQAGGAMREGSTGGQERAEMSPAHRRRGAGAPPASQAELRQS